MCPIHFQTLWNTSRKSLKAQFKPFFASQCKRCTAFIYLNQPRLNRNNKKYDPMFILNNSMNTNTKSAVNDSLHDSPLIVISHKFHFSIYYLPANQYFSKIILVISGLVVGFFFAHLSNFIWIDWHVYMTQRNILCFIQMSLYAKATKINMSSPTQTRPGSQWSWIDHLKHAAIITQTVTSIYFTTYFYIRDIT